MPMMTDMQSPIDSSPGTEQVAAREKANSRLIVLVVSSSLLYLAGLLYYAATRPIDGDEGFTLLPPVWSGKARLLTKTSSSNKRHYCLISTAGSGQSIRDLSSPCECCPRPAVASKFYFSGLRSFLPNVCPLKSRSQPSPPCFSIRIRFHGTLWSKSFAVANLLMTIATICLYIALRSGRLRWFFASGLLSECASRPARSMACSFPQFFSACSSRNSALPDAPIQTA